jgi:hypothetical protein
MTNFNPSRGYQVSMGYMSQQPNSGMANNTLNAAAKWLAFSFIAGASKQVSKIHWRINGITGSLAAGEVSCTLYDATGTLAVPGSIIEARTTTTPSPLTASSTVARTWTGFTATSTLVQGTKYWAVFKNLNASPASNFPQFSVSGGGTGLVGEGGVAQLLFDGNSIIQSVDSGANWTVVSNNCIANFVIEYSDGTLEGLYVNNINFFGGTGSGGGRIWGTQKVGFRFTMPNIRYNLRSVMFGMRRVGTMAGGAIVEVTNINTGSIVGTSIAKSNVDIVSTAGMTPIFLFETPVTLEPGTPYRITVTPTENTGDGSTNYYQLRCHELENITGNAGSIPYSASMNATTYNGTTWADGTQLHTIIHYLGGDVDNEFAPRNFGYAFA